MFAGIKIPHVVQVVLSIVVMALSHVHVEGDVVTMQFSVPAGVASFLVAAITVVGLLSDGIPTAKRAALAAAAAKAGPVAAFLGVLLVAGASQACLSSAPIVAVTPQNQAQISSCANSSTVHNVSVLSGIGFGVAGATLGAVAPFEGDQGVKGGLAAGAAASAALAGGAATVAAFAAQNFANGHCTDVVGPLPAKPDPSASAWPGDWPAPTVAESVDVAGSVVSAAGGGK